MHVDAALSGLILPLIPEASDYHFGFDKGADSIAVSGHKQLSMDQTAEGGKCTDEQAVADASCLDRRTWNGAAVYPGLADLAQPLHRRRVVPDLVEAEVLAEGECEEEG